MANGSEKRSLIIMSSVFLFVIAGTYIVTLLARGYRPGFDPNGNISLKSTGLLSATSQPKGASVYINDKLITATDQTVNLPPGNYLLKIIKDGYQSWQKNIAIKKEIVYQSDAQLFRSAPDLSPLTLSGAINSVISPDYTKIIYAVASASATPDNGLYLIELASAPLSLNKNTPRQLAPNFPGIDWSKATFTFSPNSQKVLVQFSNSNANYLIDLNSAVTQNSLLDVSASLPIISSEWQTQDQQLLQTRLDRLPKELRTLVATDSSKNVAFSTNDDKILYLAASDSAMPQNIITPPPAQSTQTQSRSIKKDNYYVYDLKDDTNFLIGAKKDIENPFWLPNTTNIVFANAQTVKATDYDSTNIVTLFAGNFSSGVVFPSADGSKIITLTSAYSGAPENLYAVTIR